MVMDEQFLEEILERSQEGLRYQLMMGNFSKMEYEWALKALNKWAEGQYEMLRRTVN